MDFIREEVFGDFILERVPVQALLHKIDPDDVFWFQFDREQWVETGKLELLPIIGTKECEKRGRCIEAAKRDRFEHMKEGMREKFKPSPPIFAERSDGVLEMVDGRSRLGAAIILGQQVIPILKGKGRLIPQGSGESNQMRKTESNPLRPIEVSSLRRYFLKLAKRFQMDPATVDFDAAIYPGMPEVYSEAKAIVEGWFPQLALEQLEDVVEAGEAEAEALSEEYERAEIGVPVEEVDRLEKRLADARRELARLRREVKAKEAEITRLKPPPPVAAPFTLTEDEVEAVRREYRRRFELSTRDLALPLREGLLRFDEAFDAWQSDVELGAFESKPQAEEELRVEVDRVTALLMEKYRPEVAPPEEVERMPPQIVGVEFVPVLRAERFKADETVELQEILGVPYQEAVDLYLQAIAAGLQSEVDMWRARLDRANQIMKAKYLREGRYYPE